MRYKRIIKYAVSLIIVFAISIFFLGEFQRNWESIQAYDLNFNALYIFLSFATIAINYLLTTYGWFVALNALSNTAKITFPESIAAVDTGLLTKYLPGKVWSYAFQIYWLAKAGFSKSLILYVSFINLYTSLMTSMLLGLSYLVFFPQIFPSAVTFSLLSMLLFLDFCFINYNSYIFGKLTPVLNGILKRDIGYFEMPKKLFLYLHLINLLAAFSFGASAYFSCLGLGFTIGTNKITLVMSSLIIADVMGFVAIIVPGGLGVREGAMYLLLTGVSTTALSLLLPIATRVVTMLVDISLGTTAVALLNSYKNARGVDEKSGNAN
jgi:uncharacterized membrane protein YbhN (UPF0104 family)